MTISLQEIIGYTKSGKAIFNLFSHEGHKNFTLQYHVDANGLHSSIADELRAKAGKPMEPESKKLRTSGKEENTHRIIAVKHHLMALN